MIILLKGVKREQFMIYLDPSESTAAIDMIHIKIAQGLDRTWGPGAGEGHTIKQVCHDRNSQISAIQGHNF